MRADGMFFIFFTETTVVFWRPSTLELLHAGEITVINAWNYLPLQSTFPNYLNHKTFWVLGASLEPLILSAPTLYLMGHEPYTKLLVKINRWKMLKGFLWYWKVRNRACQFCTINFSYKCVQKYQNVCESKKQLKLVIWNAFFILPF